MAEQQPTFDAAKYKNAQREQWNKDGAAWRRWNPTLDRWYGEMTRQMLDLARVSICLCPRSRATSSASWTIPSEMSVASTYPPGPTRSAALTAGSPAPAATSRMRWPG